MDIDEIYILRCLELARKGLGKTRQNPLVGSVIVYDKKIIGEGYHQNFGGPHAEVNAINSVKDKTLLPKSTLYVNLEPCSHFGKTPPCTSLIKQWKIPRVVIGSIDTNTGVAGNGIRILRDSGIEVISGIKEKESLFLNRRFYTFHEKKRPYIILKWAQSEDGFIDIVRKPENNGKPNWISNQTGRILVHKWRSEEMAIMAGTNTIITDDPDLTVRYWFGENPLRVIPDKNTRLSENFKIFNNKSKTLIFTSAYKKLISQNIEFFHLPEDQFSISKMMEELYKRNILSILIEGGAEILKSFIDPGMWDEARVFIGDKPFIEGIKAPVMNINPVEFFNFNANQCNIFINNHLKF